MIDHREKYSNEKHSEKLLDFEQPLGEFEYHHEIKRRSEDKGSKSARRM